MREIKFRVWDRVGEIMIHNAVLIRDGFRVEILLPVDHHGMALNWNPIYMQYTGLHDKNGKEIWEGDIMSWDLLGGRTGTVNFREAAFWIDWETDKGISLLSNLKPKEIEVIGNIYSNPELLGNPSQTSQL